MKKYIPDFRLAMLTIIVTCFVAVLLSIAWKWILFAVVQLLLNVQVIPAERYSQQIFMGNGFLAVTWVLDILSLLVAIWIAKWLIARPIPLPALKIASFAIFILLVLFPGWNSETLPNSWFMAFIWVVLPSIFFYIAGKKYLT